MLSSPRTTVGDDADIDLIDLPPLDGASPDETGEESGDEGSDNDDLDPVPTDAGKSALDDETGEDDPVDDEELDPVDEGGLDDVAAGVGAEFDEAPEFADDRTNRSANVLDDVDELGVGAEDFGLKEDASVTNVDAGEEGPTEAEEDLREEDLPLLDADGDGEGEDGDFYDLDGADAPPFAWADDRWVCKAIEGVPAAVAVVAVGSGAVAVAGEPPKLWGIVDGLAEAIEPQGVPAGGWRSLRLARRTGELFIETDTGDFVSRDGGRHFVRIPADTEAPARSRSLRDTQREIHSRDVDLRGLTIGAAAIVDETGTVLAAISRTSNALGKTWLVRFPAGGPPRSVGVVAGAVWDLAWDEPRGRVWVASDAGVLLFTSHDAGATSAPRRSIRPGV